MKLEHRKCCEDEAMRIFGRGFAPKVRKINQNKADIMEPANHGTMNRASWGNGARQAVRSVCSIIIDFMYVCVEM